MRLLLFFFLLATGCASKSGHRNPESFTFIGVPEHEAWVSYITPEGNPLIVTVRVIEVTEGRYDRPTVDLTFAQGVDSPMKIGQRYRIVANYRLYGILYSKSTELKKEPNG